MTPYIQCPSLLKMTLKDVLHSYFCIAFMFNGGQHGTLFSGTMGLTMQYILKCNVYSINTYCKGHTICSKHFIFLLLYTTCHPPLCHIVPQGKHTLQNYCYIQKPMSLNSVSLIHRNSASEVTLLK